MSAIVNVGSGDVSLDEVASVLKLLTDEKARGRLPPGMLREASRVVREAERVEGGLFHTTFPKAGPYRRGLYPKIMSFYSAGKRATQRCIMAANRVGKSRACAYEFTAHLTGMYPDWWPGRRFRQPVDTWAVGKTWSTARDIIQTELFGEVRAVRGGFGRNEVSGTGMIPRESILMDSLEFRHGTGRTVANCKVRYRDSKSEASTFALKSVEQGRGAFEGTARHVVWGDEEMSAEVWNECAIRTMTVQDGPERTRGMMILSFTPLDGLTEVVEHFLYEPSERAEVDEQWSSFDVDEGDGLGGGWSKL